MDFVIYSINVIIQMSLALWFLVLLEKKTSTEYYKFIIFILLSSITVLIFIPRLCVIGFYFRYFAYLAILMLRKFIFKKSYKDAFYDMLIIFVVFHCIQSFQLLLFKVIAIQFNDFNNYSFGVLFIILGNFSLFLLIISCKINNKILTFVNGVKDAFVKTPTMSINMLLAIFMIQLLCDYYPEQTWNNYYIFFISIWAVFTYSFINLKRNIDYIQQMKAINIYKQYNPVFSSLIEDIKKRQHEFNNHLNTIQGIINLGGNQWGLEIEKYIKSMKKETIDISKLICLENRVLAAIIYSKLIEAKGKDIFFDYRISNTNYPIKDYELVEVLGNLLDNAFEAVSKIEKKFKHVLLEMGAESDDLYLEVRNNGEQLSFDQLQNIFIGGYSTKGTGRGFGLLNVKNIINKKNGIIEIFYEEDYVVFRIKFSNNKTKHGLNNFKAIEEL